MDYDSVNYNIEETNTELANYGSWSFMTVEGHSSNVVIRLNNNNNTNNKNDLDGSGDDQDCLSINLAQSSSSISTFSLNPIDTEPASLLEVIDDKNKEIVQLKRMNYNQKLQLNYYLKKSLINDTIATLGRSINLNVPEEYDAINFSMARFNRVNNRKSRIIRAYEKLNSIDMKISHLLKKQESLLRKVTLDVLSQTAERNMVNASMNSHSDKDKENKNNNDGEFISYVSQLDVFSKLLATTLSVKRELESIKSYSRRIIVIEEERNSLVDYIYQLPVEQRLNGSYLLSVEREKAKLCMEMTNIRNDQKMLKEKISKLNHEEEYLKETAKELKAKSIAPPEGPPAITITKEEHNKLLDEVQDLRNENQRLQDKIKYQEQSLQNSMEYESKLIEVESKCATLENRIETITHQKQEKETELLSLTKLQTDYDELMHTNEALKKKLAGQRLLEDELCDLKQKVKNMDALIEERDKLRNQIDECSALRHAIEKCPQIDNAIIGSTEYFDKLCIKICKILELEKERENMKDKFEQLASALIQQDDHIKMLLNIFDRFGDYKLNKKSSYDRTKDKSPMNDMYFINLAKKIAEKFNNSRIRDILLETNLIKNKDDSNLLNTEIEKFGAGCIGQASGDKIKELMNDPKIRNCSSSEALHSVFGPTKVGHTTKIIETGELLSKLNCHIETLEETTRGFCAKNVMKSNTSISIQSSMMSIRDSDMDNRDTVPELEQTADGNDNTESQINLLEETNSTVKSKLPVRASSVPPMAKKFHGNKEDFMLSPNKKSKLLTRVSSNDRVKADNLYTQMRPSSANRKLKDLCSNADGECNTIYNKSEEKKKKSAPEAGDDLSKSTSNSDTMDSTNPNSEIFRGVKQIVKKLDDVDNNNNSLLGNVHLNVHVNTNKDKVIGDLKEIQYQLETLNNSDNTEDLRNNFKKFYSKIFGESIDALNEI